MSIRIDWNSDIKRKLYSYRNTVMLLKINNIIDSTIKTRFLLKVLDVSYLKKILIWLTHNVDSEKAKKISTSARFWSLKPSKNADARLNPPEKVQQPKKFSRDKPLKSGIKNVIWKSDRYRIIYTTRKSIKIVVQTRLKILKFSLRASHFRLFSQKGNTQICSKQDNKLRKRSWYR